MKRHFYGVAAVIGNMRPLMAVAACALLGGTALAGSFTADAPAEGCSGRATAAVMYGDGTPDGTADSVAGVRTQPEFPGGAGSLCTYLLGSMKKYEASRYSGKAVKVKASFVVNTVGDVEDVTIERHGTPEMDSAVVCILRDMPRWKPATLDGKPVRVRLHQTLNFGHKAKNKQ